MRNGLLACAAAAALTLAGCGQDVAVEENAATANQTGHMMANDPANPFAEAEMRMHERMMAATGADVSEGWIRKMIEHHRGAVEMSEILLAQGGEPAVIEVARRTADEQRREIAALERLLERGNAAAVAEPAVPAASSGTPAPSPAAREPADRSAPKAATPPPAAREPRAPPPADDPHAGHDMDNMQH